MRRALALAAVAILVAGCGGESQVQKDHDQIASFNQNVDDMQVMLNCQEAGLSGYDPSTGKHYFDPKTGKECPS